MKIKTHFFILLGYIVGTGMAIAALVFCVDPFYHYHSAWFGLPIIMDNAVYQTAGAARNLEYDSLIIGTSMTENFHASWFDELGWDTLKLSYSGARTDDLKAILEQIYSRGESPQNIVMDVNSYQLTVPAWTAYVARPEYLYDDNLLTDVSYLYNYDVVIETVERVADGLRGRDNNLDEAYVWEDESYFGRQAAFLSAVETKQALMNSENTPVDLVEMLQCCDDNLANILPFIELHPETQYFIFYPPYSMLYWEQEVLKGELIEILAVYEYSMRRFMEYENVHLYYFQNETEIISDLDNYRDTAHHHPRYNRFIYECIRDNKNLVTEENLQLYMESMRQYAENFDYDSMWNDFIP